MVLDASALLALINDEPGRDAWTEAPDLVPTVVDFGRERGHRTALMRPATRGRGLSFGDGACLALAEQPGKPALTADRAWSDLAIGVEICLIR